MSDNRLEALAAFLAANPDLPEGQDLTIIHFYEPTGNLTSS